jgi:hypothetical protein
MLLPRLVPLKGGYLSRDATASRIPGWGQRPSDESRRTRGSEEVIFPCHHGGFGQQGDPDAFAATLRRVLTDVG